MAVTVTEVKKFIRSSAVNVVTGISVTVDEYEEGFDVHVNMNYLDEWHNSEFTDFHIGEFETEKKAVARAKKVAESLNCRWEISNC